jgi:putative inorganic carbon (hco3(-)) transporter
VYLKLLVAVVVVASAAYMIWKVHPAYTLSFAIFLSPIASHWQELGIPGVLAPDRLLLIGGISQVILRAPAMRDRPPLRIHTAHVVLALAAAYAICSAFISHTLFSNTGSAAIIDAFGILPFLAFLVGPVVFDTARAREVLLVALVLLGAYLGFTVLFEMTKVNALVFPRYILNPNYGIHYGKGRGPFVDAVANGFACYVCAVACAIAIYSWSGRRARRIAAVIGIVDLVGAFLSLERSVWIGGVLATLITLALTPRLRRYLVPAAATIVLALAGSLAVSQNLRNIVTGRVNDIGPVWDRENLTVAALNMIEARPLTGFGWNRFQEYSQPYFRQSPNYPLTATTAVIHNYALFYAVGLGLPGVTLWAVGVLLGIGGAVLMRGPPELAPWRVGLLAIFVMFIVVSNSVPPTLFQNLCLWLWAGVVFRPDYARARARALAGAVPGPGRAPAPGSLPESAALPAR